MQFSFHQTLLWAGLFCSTLVLATPTDYLNVTYSRYYEQDNSPYNTELSAVVYDPITKTGASCVLTSQGQWSNPFSGGWMPCDDPTFQWKVDAFQSAAWTLEIKHQYRDAGKKCVATNGPHCTTARAYVSFDSKTTPGYGVSGSATGSWYSNHFNEPVVAPVFVRCNGGCGLTSGAY